MRRLTFLVLILSALYSGYWFFGARAVEDGGRDVLADLSGDGWQAQYTDLNTIGFPSRFDTTITDLSLTAPDGQFSWQGDFLQIFALSYQPNKVIAAFPSFFIAYWAGTELRVDNQSMRASGSVKANSSLTLDTITAEITKAEVDIASFGKISADSALTAVKLSLEAPDEYDFFLGLDQLFIKEGNSWLDERELPDTINRFSLDSTIGLDRSLDRFVFDGADPSVTNITLKSLIIELETISITAAGEIQIDPAGIPEGRITFKTEQWREVIDLLVKAEVLDAGVAPTITNVAQTMAAGSDVLELPISFQNGFMSLGPLPLGPAPRL